MAKYSLSILLFPSLIVGIFGSFDFDINELGANDFADYSASEEHGQYFGRTSNSAFEGEICNINKFPVAGDEPQIFYMCRTPVNDRQTWPWEQIGVWTKMRCKNGKWFSPESRICRHVSSVRRMQQNYCASYPQQCQPIQPPPPPPPVWQPPANNCAQPPCPQPYVPPPPPPVDNCFQPPCPQPFIPPPPPPPPQPICQQPPCQPACQPEQPSCPQPVVPRPCPQAGGGRCSWMMERLKAAGTGFKQCVPQLPGQYCGKWLRRPCAPGTKFDERLQVCVHDERGGGCAAPQIPIGPCNVRQQCPGQAVCQPRQNVCCQSGGY